MRLGRAAITALVWRDAAIAILEMRDLMPPGPVALGKAVKKDQHRRIDRPFVHHIQMHAIGEFNALLFHAQVLPRSFEERQYGNRSCFRMIVLILDWYGQTSIHSA